MTRRHTYATDDVLGVVATDKVADRWVRSTCGYCSVGCGMMLGVRGDRIVSVRGDADHPANRGALCPKGLSEHHGVTAAGRALYPMRKTWRGQRRVTWDEALDAFAEGLHACGGELAILSTGQLVTEELYALGKLARLGMGVRHYDGNTTLCMASAVAGYKRSFGSDGPPGCYDDLDQAELVVLIGANIADNHPILAQRLVGPDRPRVVVIDPRATKTAGLADVFVALRPRTDVYLLNGLAHLLVATGAIDEPAVRARADGYDELVDQLQRFTPDYVAEVTGVPEATVRELARQIAAADGVFFGWTMGVNHSTQGTETVNAICNLALLTGNVGRPGGTAFSITGQCNAMGSREASFTSSMPGYRAYDDPAARAELAGLWGVAAGELPAERGRAYPDIVDGILAGEIRGLWVIATNPLVSYPDQAKLRRALARLDFLVVQDGFHPTATSAVADLVLPAAIWGEKEGVYTSSERRVSKVNAAVPPPGEARADFDIFLALADRLGVRDRVFPGWRAPRDAFDEWRRVSAGRLCDYSGIDYELLAGGSVQWPRAAGAAASQPRLYTDGRFATPSGRARLFAVRNERPPEEPDDEFPMLLNTGRTVEHWHTRTKTGRIPLLDDRAPEAWIELNPRDAARLGVRSHDRVRVRSRRGQLDGLRVRVTETIAPGQAFVPFHYEEAPANELTLDDACPIAREPNFKQCAIRVERSA